MRHGAHLNQLDDERSCGAVKLAMEPKRRRLFRLAPHAQAAQIARRVGGLRDMPTELERGKF